MYEYRDTNNIIIITHQHTNLGCHNVVIQGCLGLVSVAYLIGIMDVIVKSALEDKQGVDDIPQRSGTTIEAGQIGDDSRGE